MIKIGLLGLGTVGTGVYQLISENRNDLKALIGEEVEISKILVNNVSKIREVELEKGILTLNPYEILDDPTINIIVEVIGGVTDAYTYIKYALNNGKHVVTANKAVIAKHMKELTSLSKTSNSALLYEASVGGGIPIIKPLRQYKNMSQVDEIKGIINGTSNFILSKMIDESMSFDESLSLAQSLGYAEADPTDDVEGYDTARKLAILSSIAFNNSINDDSIYSRGISSISKGDIDNFKEMGFTVKLLGKAIKRANQIAASVEPVLIKEKSMLAGVNGAFNLIALNGAPLGELQFYGQGAGKFPTAGAVLSDILDIITCAYPKEICDNNDLATNTTSCQLSGRYYIRINLLGEVTDEEALKYIDENLIDTKINSSKGELTLLTKETTPNEIQKFEKSLNKYVEGCFYARIDE
ncbi:homoserine dehydrogenase [Alkaliphilus peptidifermentans]|uniref:Homoserine dehydrogenase n=1 Tax=Alkaliphilus peptidifermentans DSM 18978 TaxID=1120976 RepID=A0A1G5GKS9_9FIRM|nr:homoserine dehydrogenase [Alkaliphilus peptidifermentans]SCY51967.1 homoserine dehydrogenase [Alkaliphilus peptidifermentans DSM 18978]